MSELGYTIIFLICEGRWCQHTLLLLERAELFSSFIKKWQYLVGSNVALGSLPWSNIFLHTGCSKV